MISFEPLLRRRRAILVAYALVFTAAAPGLLRLRVDNSPGAFLARDADALARFETLERSFGRDRGVRLLVEGAGLWTPHGLAWLEELEQRAEDPGGVYAAAGPIAHHRWHLDEAPAADPERFHDLLLSDPLDRQAGWLSSDGRAVTILAGMFAMPPERREATLAALEALLATAPPGVETGLVGIADVNRALDRELVATAVRSFPLLFCAAVGLLWLFFRSWAGVLLPLALVGASEGVLLGAMGYAGQRLDVVTILLIPVVFVIALATAVHVLAFHRTRRAGEGIEAVSATYRLKAWPVLWAGLTTATAFGSLAVSGVTAVCLLGLWAAFGIVFLTLAALSFYPALMASVRLAPTPPAGATRNGAPRGLDARIGLWAERGASWSVGHRRRVFALFALGAALAACGIVRLELGTNVLSYLRTGHPIRMKVAALEARGLGAVTASLVLESAIGFDDEGRLSRLRRLAASLRDDPLVLGALGVGDLAENVERYRPEAVRAQSETTLELMRAHPDLRRLAAFLLHREGRRTRIVLVTRMRGWEELQPLYRRAEGAARRAFPEAESWVAGLYPLILAGQHTLLRTIVVSLGLTLLVVAVTFAFLSRSPSLAVRCLLPNLWPVMVVLGAMGWFGVPVDSSTVMIAAVVLGLAVDDTLHVLAHFRRLAAVRGSAAGAVEALAQTGAGLVVTSIVLALGFAVCALSSLVPVARFGVVTALAVLAALAADLWLVPALFSTARAPVQPG